MDKPGVEPGNVGCLIAHLAIKGWISFILPLCMEKPTINRAFSVYQFRHLSVCLYHVRYRTFTSKNKTKYHYSHERDITSKYIFIIFIFLLKKGCTIFTDNTPRTHKHKIKTRQNKKFLSS